MSETCLHPIKQEEKCEIHFSNEQRIYSFQIFLGAVFILDKLLRRTFISL